MYFDAMGLPLVVLLVCTRLLAADHLAGVFGDVGTAAPYGPPYLPTRCSQYSDGQLPEDGMFVAVNPGIWDNGAACGRMYRLRCLSGLQRPCKDGSIVVQVVDVCKGPCSSTLALSNRAFSALSKMTAKINVEYAQI